VVVVVANEWSLRGAHMVADARRGGNPTAVGGGVSPTLDKVGEPSPSVCYKTRL